MSDIFDRLRAALGARYVLEREAGAGGMAIVYQPAIPSAARDLLTRGSIHVKQVPRCARDDGSASMTDLHR